jgi:hypothetical protein
MMDVKNDGWRLKGTPVFSRRQSVESGSREIATRAEFIAGDPKVIEG